VGVAKVPGFDERSAVVRGGRIRYFTAGEGAPVVLIHGLGGGAANWMGLARGLARRRRVLVPDLPGHGRSEPAAAAPTVAAYADRLALLLELEGMLPATLVGHSFGGSVALRLAVRRPEAVAGIVLAGAAGITTRRRIAQAVVNTLALARPGRFVARARGQIAARPWLRYPVFGRWGAEDPGALSGEAVEGFLAPQLLHTDTLTAGRALALEDSRTELHLVRCPCLVLWGSKDALVTVADAFEYGRRLRAPVRVIAGCGHLLIGERPDACLDAIDKFLDGAPHHRRGMHRKSTA
jgi:pimeloyl-ACP methyl ester carboxylesterase